MLQNIDLTPYLSQIKMPAKGSSKGDNGRVLVIGGSRLFHAAAFWSACMASRLVDMVHFTSPVMENNDLMRLRAKAKFWDGIVVPYQDVEHYIEEDDAILIGPGMERGPETREIIDNFLKKYPDKKWIIDGGALQEVDPTLLTGSMIITPNIKELKLLNSKYKIPNSKPTILAKGETDTVTPSTTHDPRSTIHDPSSMTHDPKSMIHDPSSMIHIPGGSPGLTRGGTGDVLAGLVLGLSAKSPAFAACVVASYCLKAASEELSTTIGPFFSPTDLIKQVPHTLNSLLKV